MVGDHNFAVSVPTYLVPFIMLVCGFSASLGIRVRDDYYFCSPLLLVLMLSHCLDIL